MLEFIALIPGYAAHDGGMAYAFLTCGEPHNPVHKEIHNSVSEVGAVLKAIATSVGCALVLPACPILLEQAAELNKGEFLVVPQLFP